MATMPEIDAYTHDHVFLGAAHDDNARRTLWVVALTAAMMAVEIVAGYLTGSMALLADGFHMATHAGALGLLPPLTPTPSVTHAIPSTVSALARLAIWRGSPRRCCLG